MERIPYKLEVRVTTIAERSRLAPNPSRGVMLGLLRAAVLALFFHGQMLRLQGQVSSLQRFR
jgi:hypothetical protein